MEWGTIGARVRKQREYMGYTREQFAELIDVTPKFCSDIELGVKGMSVPTLCKISQTLHISTDYILFGLEDCSSQANSIQQILNHCDESDRYYAEQLLKTFVIAVDRKSRLS